MELRPPSPPAPGSHIKEWGAGSKEHELHVEPAGGWGGVLGETHSLGLLSRQGSAEVPVTGQTWLAEDHSGRQGGWTRWGRL